MAATPFDTLTAAQDLEAAGIERKHAEAIAKVVNHGDERAATKADLDTVATTLRSELDALRSDLDTFAITLSLEIRAVSSRVSTLQWVVGIQSAVTLATFAIVAAKLL